MKTATVRELRNHYAGLLEWIEAGEEIRITRRGIPIARLVPESGDSGQQVQWNESPALMRDRSQGERIPADISGKLIHDSAGRW
ncbi:MAG: type II toxin-antitoxin system prevent-host-death family antitoxin [Kiritimatiellae bacterium]|jgi:prevent-host-death family protein|nr:type II toxin-antitoxin system prevent-host-death family antitoxin [Kiritimatiellia bacterium]